MSWNTNNFLSADPNKSRLIFVDDGGSLIWTSGEKTLMRTTLFNLYLSPTAKIDVFDQVVAVDPLMLDLDGDGFADLRVWSRTA